MLTCKKKVQMVERYKFNANPFSNYCVSIGTSAIILFQHIGHIVEILPTPPVLVFQIHVFNSQTSCDISILI